MLAALVMVGVVGAEVGAVEGRVGGGRTPRMIRNGKRGGGEGGGG